MSVYDLSRGQTTLLELAERTSDSDPSFSVSFVEDRYYEVQVDVVIVRGHTIAEAVAKATVKLAALVESRSGGDVETLKATRKGVAAMADYLESLEDGRQLRLDVDRAVPEGL